MRDPFGWYESTKHCMDDRLVVCMDHVLIERVGIEEGQVVHLYLKHQSNFTPSNTSRIGPMTCFNMISRTLYRSSA